MFVNFNNFFTDKNYFDVELKDFFVTKFSDFSLSKVFHYVSFCDQILLNYYLLIIVIIASIFCGNTIFSILFFMLGCIIFCFICLLLGYEFLALSILIIYVGAICILILFQAKLIKKLVEQNYYDNIFYSKNYYLSILALVFLLGSLGFSFFFFNNEVLFFELEIFGNYGYDLDKDWLALYFDSFHNFLVKVSLFLYDINNSFYLILGGLVLLLAMIGAIVLLLS